MDLGTQSPSDTELPQPPVSRGDSFAGDSVTLDSSSNPGRAQAVFKQDPDDDRTDVEDADEATRVTPLPKMQLAAAMLIQLAEPITATCIYPFVNEFVRRTGVTGGDERLTGYYAGLIESIFFLAECLTVVQWGYLADRFGRRPVLLIAPLGLTFAMLGFGSSTRFWGLVVSRCFQGIFNGNIGVSKTVMAEISDESNIGDIFALMPLVWSLGTTSGPTIGGMFSNPSIRFPNSLGKIKYLQTHPYFLPCAVAGLLSFFTFVFSWATLKETHKVILARKAAEKSKVVEDQNTLDDVSTPLLRDQAQSKGHSTPSKPSYGSTDDATGSRSSVDLNAQAPVAPAQTGTNDARSLLLTRPFILLTLNIMMLTFLDMSYAALVPLMFSTSIANGGLGLNPYQIGLALSLFGCTNAIIQFLFLGRLMRYLGPKRLYGISICVYVFCVGMLWLEKMWIRRMGLQEVDRVVIGLVMLQLAAQMLTYTCYGSMQVLVVQNVPPSTSTTVSPLATINGFYQMVGSGMRTLAPTFASSLFSFSLTRNVLGGDLVYVVLISMGLVAVWLGRHMPRGTSGYGTCGWDKGKGKEEKGSPRERVDESD